MQQNLFPSTLAELKVLYSHKVKDKDKPKVASSQDAEKLFRAIWSEAMELREEFYILLLNRANRALGYYRLSEGGISGTVADQRLLFSIALKCNAVNVIMAHNHPSGNLEPSLADRHLTKRIKDAGKLLEIEILDHLILTKEGYYSFADEGII